MSRGAIKFPWIVIPKFAEPGQPHAFANREQQLAQLYKMVVSAGNAVRRPRREGAVRLRAVVTGYMGVGKSALILQALGMIRSEDGVVEGQTVPLPVGLPEPEDRQLWLILRASGKHVSSFDAIADALQQSMLAVLDDVAEEARREIPGVLELPFFHRLFKRREVRLYAEVRSALEKLTKTIEYVRFWQGSLETRSLEQSVKADSSQEAEIQLEGQLKREGREPRTTEARAAVKAAAGIIRQTSMASTTSVERKLTINAQWVVDALNEFFAATDRAGIPTILVLDDFDEFASSIGPSHHERSQVLSSVLGTFNKLAPTCLLIGLREEYMHEDIQRQYEVISVPPLTRGCAAAALDAWALRQSPPLEADVMEALRHLGDRFLRAFDYQSPVVIPYRFLQLVTWNVNSAGGFDDETERLVLRYLQSQFPGEVVRSIQRIAKIMPGDDVLPCAEAVPLDPEPYALTPREHKALTKYGLLRPAMAGDPSDKNIVLDPLFAYLRMAITTDDTPPV